MNFVDMCIVRDLANLVEDIKAKLCPIDPHAERTAMEILEMVMDSDIPDQCYREQWDKMNEKSLLDGCLDGEQACTDNIIFQARPSIEEDGTQTYRNVYIVKQDSTEERLSKLESWMAEQQGKDE